MRSCENKNLFHYESACVKTSKKKPLRCVGENGYQTENQTRSISCWRPNCTGMDYSIYAQKCPTIKEYLCLIICK